MAQRRKSAFQISYVTITYRSVILGLFGVLLLAGVVMYFAFPETANKIILAAQSEVSKAMAKMGLASANASGQTPDPGPQQAHFTNIDGTVRVKKASSNTWVAADYSLALERGDVVQTSSEGIAKVVFTDGTNYTVKPDSLIMIQENSVNAAQQARVAVEVTTGTVDLSTTNTSGRGSKSQVIFDGATATLPAEVAAQVNNDPRKDEHDIRVTKGSGIEIVRGEQTLQIAQNEDVRFTNTSPEMVKTKVIAPPVLIGPANMRPQYVTSKNTKVTFYWSEVDMAKEYHIKIAKTPYFAPSSLVLDAKVAASTIDIKDFKEGAYWWEVQSVGEDGKESAESERNKFMIIPQEENNSIIALDLEPLRQMGHVFEIRGRTEPSARVMVNGQDAIVNSDGTFHHFTTPLPAGENLITITAQNSKGGAKTVPIRVFIP